MPQAFGEMSWELNWRMSKIKIVSDCWWKFELIYSPQDMEIPYVSEATIGDRYRILALLGQGSMRRKIWRMATLRLESFDAQSFAA